MGSSTSPAELVAVTDGRRDDDIQTIRRRTLGASEVASVLGLSKWQTELELYLHKRGELERPFEGNELTYWGLMSEDIIIPHRARIAAASELTVIRPKRIYRSRRAPALSCSPDAIEYPFGAAIDLSAPPPPRWLDDAKTADSFTLERWIEQGPGPQYILQLQAGAYVLGAEAVALDVLFGGNHYRRFEYEVDPELGEMCAQVATDFMARVEAGEPPAAQYDHENTAAVLARLYPGVEKERKVLSEAAARALLDLEDLGEQAAWVKQEQERLRNLVRAELRDGVEGVCPWTKKTVVTWTKVNDTAVEVSLPELRKNHPHLYRMVERRVGRPAGRSTRINLRHKALTDTREAFNRRVADES